MYTLLFGGWAAAWTLDQWCEHDWPVVTVLVLFGSYISYIYSAPPLKLKQRGLARKPRAGRLVHRFSPGGRAGGVRRAFARRDGHDRALLHRGSRHRHRQRLQVHRGRSPMGLMSLPVAHSRGGEGEVDRAPGPSRHAARRSGYRAPHRRGAGTPTRASRSSSPRFSSSSNSSCPDPIKNDASTRRPRSASWCSVCSPPAWLGAPHQPPQHVNRARRGVRGDEGVAGESARASVDESRRRSVPRFRRT